MTTNIVTAKFCNSRRTTTRPLTQYDYGQILRIEGIDLPDAYEVDFSNNQYTGDSKPQLGDASGVAIPEEYIETGKDIYAFIYLHAGESDGETFYWIKIPNELRPARTEETPTPEEQSIIDQTIAALNTGVQKVEDIADGLEEQIDTALQEAKDSGEFDGEDGFSPEITVEDITGGHRVTVVDKDGTETFDVMDGEDGDTGRGIVTIEKTSTSGLVDTYTITYSDNTTGTFYVTNGENGDPGTPGFSPVVAISSITGGHRVTITSATGTDSFDVLDGVDGEDGNGIASVELNDDYTLTLTFDDGTSYTTTSIRGEPGENGVSPTASVTQTTTGATITVTDARGTTTANLTNGQNGDPGISPTITITSITDGHRVTITDADGTHSFDVMDGTDGDNGRGIASVVLNSDYTLTFTYTDGTTYTTSSIRGTKGDDGYSPIASVNKVGNVATITITDEIGTTTATVNDGEDGTPGVSPTVTVTDITGGHRITITDATGAHSFDVMDGDAADAPVQSVNGKTGVVVLNATDVGAGTYSKPSGGIPASDLAAAVQTSLGKADTALQSAPVQSVNGQTGAVVLDAQDIGAYEKPTTGIPKTDLESAVQVSLGKADTALQSAPVISVNSKTGAVVLTPSDIGAGTYSKPSGGIPASDLAAGVIPTVPVQDVQVNGASVLSSGVANVPIADSSNPGVVKVGESMGIDSNGAIDFKPASGSDVIAATSTQRAITPKRQHEATFFGLAKAAGDASQQSAGASSFGNYTESAKSAISQMLNGPVSVSGTTPIITALSGVRYVCGEVATLSFTPSATGVCDVTFTSGSTATVLTVPNTVKWPAWFNPASLEANATYEINILDGVYGAVGVWI